MAPDEPIDEALIEHVSNDHELILQCQLFHYDIKKFRLRKLAIAAIEAVKSYKHPENEKPYVFATHADEALESIAQENRMKICNCPKCHNFKEHGHVCPIKASTHTP